MLSVNVCEKMYEIRETSHWWWSFYLTLCLFFFYLFYPHQVIICSFYIMFVITGTAVMWNRFPDPITVNSEWGGFRVSAGGKTSLRITLNNRSFLPWTQVRVILSLPCGLGRRKYVQPVIIGPRQQKYIEIEVDCKRRGVYQLPPVEIHRSDIFGMCRNREKWQGTGEIVVYPAFIDLLFEKFPRNRPFGQVRVKEKAFEDYSSLASLRDYLPGDPMRKIEWKATARLNKLQVKDYELTATGSLFLVPDVNSDVHALDERREPTEETTISAAATIARLALERNAKVGFITADYRNEHLYTSSRYQTLEYILERMARLKTGNRIPAGSLLSKTVPYLPRGAMIVVITPALHDEMLLKQLYNARYRGCRVLALWQHAVSGKGDGEESTLISSLERAGIEVMPFGITG